MTWAILIVNAVALAYLIGTIAILPSASAGCHGTYAQDCTAGNQLGQGLAIALLIVFWVIADFILGIIWLVTKPRGRDCPVCGERVKRGMVACGACGYDFRSALQAQMNPSVAGPQLPPAGWYPNPAGQGRRWWDGQRWVRLKVRPAVRV